jgi:hypothetical protein
MKQSSKDQIVITLEYLEEELHRLVSVLEKLKDQVDTEEATD